MAATIGPECAEREIPMLNNLRISPFTVAEIRRYYSTRIPNLKTSSTGKIRLACPLHGGKNHSFLLDLNTGHWHCFSDCGRGGSVFDFEMTLTGADFKTAMAAVYAIVGRPMSERARMTREQWRAAQQTIERTERERNEAAYFAAAALIMAELVLENLLPWDTERAIHTKLVEDLRSDAIAVYRDWRDRNPKTAAARVDAGHRHHRRLQKSCLRFVESMANEDHSDAA